MSSRRTRDGWGAQRGLKSEVKPELWGKNVSFIDDSSKATLTELRTHLARFNLTWTLRRIGELSALVKGNEVTIGGVTTVAYSLPYLALLAVEVSSDDVVEDPGHEHIAEAARLFNGLEEPPSAAEGSDWDGFEFLIRTAYAQLGAPHDLHNATARAWMLYNDVWPSVAAAKNVAVEAQLRRLTGLSLKQVVMFGFAYSGRAAPGWFEPYSVAQLRALPLDLGVGAAEQEAFLRWVGASYADIRQTGSRTLPDEAYDKYRLSPFLVKPVIRPERRPEGASDSVHLVPAPTFLARRVTDGIYHALATASDAGGVNNAFRTAFGYVFQEYIGILLRAGSGSASVLAEFPYGPKAARRDSPDWMIIDGNRLVVIEVKQSAITLGSKMAGSIENVTKDLRKTLTVAARQVLAFRDDLAARVVGLEAFADVTDVELLVITHDQIPFANSLFRGLIVSDGVSGARDVHFCSVDDFENLQRYSWGNSLFKHLRSKHDNAFKQSHSKDFHDWLSDLGPPWGGHSLLLAVFKRLRQSWGVTLEVGSAKGA